MKKVLIVAYSFPPVGGVGVQRPTKFVKYLREFGWEPLVLTVANPSVPLIDTSLLRDIPAGVKVFRARTLEPSYSTKQGFAATNSGVKGRMRHWLKNAAAQCLLPDMQVLWFPGLILKILKIWRTEKPDCLFVTAPPFSSFLPVVLLGKILKLPVVIDFRDEWAYSRQQWEHAVRSTFAFRFDRLLESCAIKYCSRYVAVNESYVSSINSEYPECAHGKGSVITNGFDVDDFVGVKKNTNNPTKITFVYAGTVWNGNSLKNIVKAIKVVLRKRPGLSQELSVRVFGRVVGEHSEYLSDPEIKDIVTLYGYQDHEIIVEEMCNADVLLLSITDLPNANKIILGKAFEYMATGNHILAIVPDGETMELLRNNYNKLTLADANDLDKICTALVDIITNIGSIRATIANDVSCFSRKVLTSQLAAVFDQVTGAYES